MLGQVGLVRNQEMLGDGVLAAQGPGCCGFCLWISGSRRLMPVLRRILMTYLKGMLALAACCLVVSLSCLPSFGQAIYGNIVGTVTDPSGAPVPNAKVTITNVGQGVTFATTTNTSGNYQQSHLIVGTYTVKVDAPGFQTFIQHNVAVNVNASAAVNVKLKVGAITQTVTVTSAPPVLQTQKTSVSTLYTMRSVESLPLLNRNFSYLTLYAPGAMEWSSQHAEDENPQGTIQMMINGQEFGGTDYQLDGTDNHDVILGIQVVNPNLDSLSEATVTTEVQDAEFAQSDAGVVIAQTKSGTNQIHGSAFGFRRTDYLQSRNPFSQSVVNPVTGAFLPPTLWDEFGGSLGGPIKKDKTFWFGDYQGTRQRNGGSILVRVPTMAERAGDLNDLGVNIYDPFSASGALLPPTLRTQFPVNTIPTAMLSPQALKLLSTYIPTPDIPGATGAVPNYAASGTQPFDTDAFDVRIDQYQTDKLHLFGRYSFQRYSLDSPGAFGNEAGGPNFANIRFAGLSSARTQSLASGFDYTVSPTMLTDFRLAFFRYRVFTDPNGDSTTPAADAGIPGLNMGTSYTGGMPGFFINGAQGSNGSAPGGFEFGYALGINGCNCPLNEQEQQFQFVNNWTDIHGNHTFKFGGDIRRAMNLRVPSDSHRAGELYFQPAFTSGPSGGGTGLAGFLLGYPSTFDRYVSNVTDAAERQTRMFYYGEDTWRATPKLTVHFGSRWEIYFPQTVTCAECGGWVNPTTLETEVAGTPGVGFNGNIRNSLTNFGPVAGIAYQVTPKTVVRLGYGRDFDVGLFGSIFGHTVTQNIPVLAEQSLTPSADYGEVFSFNQGPPPLNPATILQTQPRGITGLPLYPGSVASPHLLPLAMRLPTVDSWNLTVERQLTSNTSIQAAYVGNKGTHVFAGDGPNYNANTPTVAGYLTASLPGCPAPCTFSREPYYLQTYDYLLSQGYSTPAAESFAWSQSVGYYGNDSNSYYNSLQIEVNHRFSHGVQVLGYYTLSRCLDYGGPYYSVNQAIAFGPCDFNQKQNMTLENMVALPFGNGQRFLRNASRPVDYLVGGWTWNAVWRLASGVPFSPSYISSGSDNDSGVSFPNQIGNAVLSNRTQSHWFATSGVVGLANGQCGGPWCRPQVGQLGDASWDSLVGPHFFQADMSLFKNFKITERVSGQVRMEVYNAFNVANLGQPDTNVDDSTAGEIFGTAANSIMREVDFAVRFDW
jgi:hypothetical protein